MTPIEWALGGDTGTSSKTICAVMTGSELDRHDIPYDGGDFGRCYRLLKIFPEWQQRLKEVSNKFPMWGPIVEAWDELSTLYETKENEKLYSRMKELVDAGRLAAGWTRTGPGSWQGPNIRTATLPDGAEIRI